MCTVRVDPITVVVGVAVDDDAVAAFARLETRRHPFGHRRNCFDYK